MYLNISLKLTFLNFFSRIPSECQTVWTHDQAQHFVHTIFHPRNESILIMKLHYWTGLKSEVDIIFQI